MIFRKKSKSKIWLSIGETKLEGKIAKTTLQILVMTLSIGLLFFLAIFNITRASHLQKV
jgi:hypothetical protein